ncbi:MAG: hypothetical protein SF339_18105 [Blastocatellia bacterium]|nr:hypothetical protein [Blastocatellia bacterium]
MSKFITELTGISFRVLNPFLFQTKAEMCRHPEVRRLRDCIKLTFSCDGFPIRQKDQPQCGICTSCLLRRLSLESAGLSDFDSRYLHDFTVDDLANKRKKLAKLSVMDWQARQIGACLRSPAPWQELIHQFPALQDVLAEVCRTTGTEPDNISSGLLRLYSQYVQEWDSFSGTSLLTKQALAA